MTHFWADFATFRGAFFSITHYFLDLSEGKKKKKVRVCDFLGPADQGGGRLFSRFAVIQKLLTENKMDILLRTDYTYGGHFSTSLQEVS